MLNKIKLIYNKYSKIHLSNMTTLEFKRFIRAKRILENATENKKKFGEVTKSDKIFLKIEYENYERRKLELKEKKKKLFESKYFYQSMFDYTSLSADFGQFTCSNCGSIFYHSPSSIFKGSKMITPNACGHCVNQYLKRDIFH